MQLSRVLTLLAFAVPAAAHAASVVVLDFPDVHHRGSGKKIREQVVTAFKHAPDLQVIPLDDLLSAARRKHVKPRDIDRPETLGRLCTAVGADGAVRAERDGSRIHILVIDRSGAQAWDRSMDLDSHGLLKGDTARRLAKAVGVALEGQAPAPSEGLSGNRPPPGGDDTAAALEELEQPQRQPAAPPSRRRPSEAAESEPPPEEHTARTRPTLIAEESRRSAPEEEVKPRDEVTPRDEATGGEAAQKVEARGAAPAIPMVDVQFDFAPVWRQYSFCPGVLSCSQSTPPGAGSPVQYNTTVPYGSVELSGELFPLRGLNNLARGIGVSGHYFQSLLLQSHYKQPNGTDQAFGSGEQRFGGEGLFRLTFDVPAGAMWVTARVGWEEHLFSVEANPVITESLRSGLIFGVDASFPLTSALRVNARFEDMPFAGPGPVEQTQYGTPAAGGGFLLRGGLSYDIFVKSGVAASLYANFDMLSFTDRYSGGGAQAPQGGVASELYLGAEVGARARY